MENPNPLPESNAGERTYLPSVFFDGGCPLCSREIAHYRRLDREGRLRWLDITRSPELLASHGLNMTTAMQRFHVLDKHGQWHTGAWGFVEMWSHLPYYRWLSKALRLSGSVGLLDKLYAVFARWRAERRCSDLCAPKPRSPA